MGRLVQKAADERVGGCCAVQLGQACRGQEMAHTEAMGDEQTHELGPVIQEGIHKGGFQVDGLAGVGWIGKEVSTQMECLSDIKDKRWGTEL